MRKALGYYGRLLGALAANAPTIRAGYRDAGRFAPPAESSATVPRESGRLERYFDANLEGLGIWKWRHYFPIYERHLTRFAGRPVTVVEVGVFSGGSLGMWRAFFGPEARIIGVDIEDACRVYEAEGVEIVIGDQGDPAFWKDFRRRFPDVDVLIDDGGHEAHQQITTLREMLPHLRAGGVLICEDIHGAFQPFHAYVDGLTRAVSDIPGGVSSRPRPVHQHIESVHRYPLVAVIEKPAGHISCFEAPRHGTQWQPFL
jgi:cephalosporin hydroxylase